MNLKCVCIRKIVDTYNIDINFASVYQLNEIVDVFQKIQPSLSKQIFYKPFKEKDSAFGKFLWFFYSFIWTESIKTYLITDCKETILTNWVRKNCKKLGEIKFIGCEYTNGNLYFGLAFEYHKGTKSKRNGLSHQMINYQTKIPREIRKNRHRLVRSVRLTVISEDFIAYIFKSFPVFFDINKGVLFDFYKTLELTGFPGFICKDKIYYYFVRELLYNVAGESHNSIFYKFIDMPICVENALSILKVISLDKNETTKRSI